MRTVVCAYVRTVIVAIRFLFLFFGSRFFSTLYRLLRAESHTCFTVGGLRVGLWPKKMKDRRPSRAVALYYTYTSRLLRLPVRKEIHLLGRFPCFLLVIFCRAGPQLLPGNNFTRGHSNHNQIWSVNVGGYIGGCTVVNSIVGVLIYLPPRMISCPL